MLRVAAFVLAAGTAFAQTPDGAALYAKDCAINSGYGFLGGAAGNVLLAFSVDGR
jgi:hypothetical protein